MGDGYIFVMTFILDQDIPFDYKVLAHLGEGGLHLIECGQLLGCGLHFVGQVGSNLTDLLHIIIPSQIPLSILQLFNGCVKFGSFPADPLIFSFGSSFALLLSFIGILRCFALAFQFRFGSSLPFALSLLRSQVARVSGVPEGVLADAGTGRGDNTQIIAAGKGFLADNPEAFREYDGVQLRAIGEGPISDLQQTLGNRDLHDVTAFKGPGADGFHIGGNGNGYFGLVLQGQNDILSVLVLFPLKRGKGVLFYLGRQLCDPQAAAVAQVIPVEGIGIHGCREDFRGRQLAATLRAKFKPFRFKLAFWTNNHVPCSFTLNFHIAQPADAFPIRPAPRR